jgi:hypothetical protein
MSDLNTFKQHLDDASTVLVCLPQGADADAVAAALSLYLSIKSYGKKVTPISVTKPVVRDSHLVGLDKITDSVGGLNLVITFNLPEDAVDKVTSNTEGGHLNLVISPKPGTQPIQKEHISFTSSGSAADLVVVVGAQSLGDLGALAEKEHELFDKSPVINLSNRVGSFGVVNLTDEGSSNCELVTALIQELKLPLDPDIANNLMQGIQVATNNLTSDTMTADTFEALAVLYRAGARRTPPAPSAPQAKVISDTPIIDVESKDTSVKETRPAPDQSRQTGSQPDWLKPKIFKGGQPSRK